MPIVQIEANETEDNPELKPENAFQINHADKSFHVYALSKADKVNWMSNLTKQINKFSKEGIDNMFTPLDNTTIYQVSFIHVGYKFQYGGFNINIKNDFLKCNRLF
jgi:hypothetical protein